MEAGVAEARDDEGVGGVVLLDQPAAAASVTCSTSFCVSMPNGPSASVVQRIDGPSARRSVASAASRPAVTAGFEFGLMTRMSARAMVAPSRLPLWMMRSLDDRPVKLQRIVGWVERNPPERKFLPETCHVHQALRPRPARRHRRDRLGGVPGRCGDRGRDHRGDRPQSRAGRAGHRRARQAGAARRHRQPRPYRAGLGGRHSQCRHLRERDRVGGVRRHHHGDPVRRPAHRHEARRGGRCLSRARQEGRGDRLRLPHDHRRSDRGGAAGSRAEAGESGSCHHQGVHDL